MEILDRIQSPADIKTLEPEQLKQLCAEIRALLVQTLSHTGGHLASNLGVVELTVAIHRVYNTEKDRLVFDVGHQCYTHKLLTGRAAGFTKLRCTGGVSGFPKPEESVHDAFIAGHASNSISVALGMARARTALGADYDVLALIGDGALNGGMAFEALSDAGKSGEPLVIILNDNGMSINPTEGGLADMLARMRTRPGYIAFKRWYRRVLGTKVPRLYKLLHRVKMWLKDRIIPDNMFDDFGFEYIGPVNGHDLTRLESVIRWAREQRKPCLVHVITQKGHGYSPAENAPEAYHSIGEFDPATGVPKYTGEDFSAVFGRELTALAKHDNRIVAITAAMKEGTGLIDFQETFPERFFDVGIAEEHACAMAAGMAKQGLVPVFAVYSTFLQRSYDMLIHDVSLQGLHVVLAVDRAGIVGRDGQTHQGSFDVAYLSSVPGMKIYSPASFAELRAMLRRAVLEETGPVAVRYPRGGEHGYKGDCSNVSTAILCEGTDATIAVYGIETGQGLKAAELLAKQGVSAEVVKLNVLSPIDETPVLTSVKKTGILVVPEEACADGCIGERLLAAVAENGAVLRAARLMNLGNGILPHGTPEELRKLCELDGLSIANAILEINHAKNKT